LIAPQLVELRAMARQGRGSDETADAAAVTTMTWEQWNNHWTQWTKIL